MSEPAPAPGALVRALQELNRAVPRVNLRAIADAAQASGPLATPAAELGAAELREEIAALSALFIEELWRHLAGFLASLGAVLATPSPRGDGFERLDVLGGEGDGGDGGEGSGGGGGGGFDPVCEAAVRIEALVVSFGRFTEHALGARAAADPGAPRAAAYRRYRELVAALPPRGTHTPTSHGAGNALAGMQLTLALAEVAPRAFAAQHGRPMRRDELDALVGGAAFEQLVHAIGASSARVSNALLATLCPDRFAAWGHSLLAMPGAERSARRLRLDPAAFVVAPGPGGPRLDAGPEALARLRALAGELETPGRTHQVACPAFAAPAEAGHVFGAFTRWLIAICRAHLVPRWAP